MEGPWGMWRRAIDDGRWRKIRSADQRGIACGGDVVTVRSDVFIGSQNDMRARELTTEGRWRESAGSVFDNHRRVRTAS